MLDLSYLHCLFIGFKQALDEDPVGVMLHGYAFLLIFAACFPLFRVPESGNRSGFKTYAGSWYTGPDGFTLWFGNWATGHAVGLELLIAAEEFCLSLQAGPQVYRYKIARTTAGKVVAKVIMAGMLLAMAAPAMADSCQDKLDALYAARDFDGIKAQQKICFQEQFDKGVKSRQEAHAAAKARLMAERARQVTLQLQQVSK